jgi:hypothetical protein
MIFTKTNFIKIEKVALNSSSTLAILGGWVACVAQNNTCNHKIKGGL